MVTGMETLCVRDPLVPVTVTVPLSGVVPPPPPPLLLPPPHETRNIITPSSKKPSSALRHARLERRLRRGFMVNTMPRAKAKEDRPSMPRCEKGNGAPRNLPVRVAALMVRVEVPLPPVTVAGDRLQVVVPSPELTAQVRATLSVKPDVGLMAMVSVPVWPLENTRALEAEVMEKSGLVPFTVTAMGTR